MKITADYLRQLIKEETQGEMEFAELEAARQAYLEEPNDDTKHELGQMINKLVEPIMAKMGLWWEAEAYYNVGELVFSNHDDMEVIIDPRGSRGGYDLKISPLVGAEDDFEVIEDTFGSMKGVTQFIYDLENPHDDGMVGEPEAQTELPFGEGVKRLKESSSRFEVELFMKDKASGLFRDGLSPKAVEMELIEFFMDKIDGPEHPIVEYEGFLKSLAREPEHQVANRREHKMRIAKSQLQKMIKEELLKEVEISGRPSDRMEDYESDYRDAPSPVDPLLAAATAAYQELAEWLDNPAADENTGRVLDQLAAAINNAGGNV